MSLVTAHIKLFNLALVRRNWLLGRRIAEEELNGESRAGYGLEIIKKLSKELTDEYGKGFTKTNLYNFYMFYKTFPKIFHAASGKSGPLLSWTHYRTLLQVKDDNARTWYEKEAIEQTWAVRTLQRNIDPKYFNIITTDAYDVTIMSRNTGHYWYLHSPEYPDKGTVIVFHSHHADRVGRVRYHLHGRANTLRKAVRSIRRHDRWQLNGRKP